MLTYEEHKMTTKKSRSGASWKELPLLHSNHGPRSIFNKEKGVSMGMQNQNWKREILLLESLLYTSN